MYYCQELFKWTRIKNLNNLVNLFLDIAENNAERNITMYMENWKNEGEDEYEKYNVIQDKNYVSDFDRLLSETK